MTCRICYEDGDLISPCACAGTMAHVHKECLEKWIAVSQRSTCELCHKPFDGSLVETPSLTSRRWSSPYMAYAFSAFVLGLLYAIGNWLDILYYSTFDDWPMVVTCIMFNLSYLCVWAGATRHIQRGLLVTGVWYVVFGLASTVLNGISQTLVSTNLLYTHVINLVVVCASVGCLSRCI